MTPKLLFAIFLLAISIFSFGQNAEADTIISRYKQFLFLTDTANHNIERVPLPNENGRWSDVDYADTQPGGWQLSVPMRRIKQMAFIWSDSNNTAYHDPEIFNDILLALGDWFQHRYKSKNWWHNEIGIPQLMRDVLALMEPKLPADVRLQCLEILKQHRVSGTGANLVWSADLGLHYGAFTGDTIMMRRCRDAIITVVKISTQEGVQPDYSFHQHGKRLQEYHYGGAFLNDNVRLAWQLSNTSLAFPPEKIAVLTGYLLNGWQWMSRGINTVPATIDRAASRNNALHSPDIRTLIPMLYQVQPDSIAAFKKLLANQNGVAWLSGYRYFPYSDFTAYQQPTYSFFLKTNSTRTMLTESINEENLKGSLLNCGNTYFIATGNEYYNLMPFWNWDKLPGITNFANNHRNKIIQQTFSGNVSTATSGAAAMHHVLEGDAQQLNTYKFWASAMGVTVVLIAQPDSGTPRSPIYTVLNQSRQSGAVTIDKPGNSFSTDTRSYSRVKWIQEGSFAYLPLYNDSAIVSANKVAARWYDINHSGSKDTLYDDVFTAEIIHRNPASGYAVSYAATPLQAKKIAAKPYWQVLQNTVNCQAVLFASGELKVAVYKALSQQLKRGLIVTTNRPCMLLQQGRQWYISDPLHEGGEIELSINGKATTVQVPADGTTIAVQL